MNRQNLLPNQAQGAEGKPTQHHSRLNFLNWIFQVAPFRKSKIAERLKTRPTSLAALICGTHFLDEEPLPQTNK